MCVRSRKSTSTSVSRSRSASASVFWTWSFHTITSRPASLVKQGRVRRVSKVSSRMETFMGRRVGPGARQTRHGYVDKRTPRSAMAA